MISSKKYIFKTAKRRSQSFPPLADNSGCAGKETGRTISFGQSAHYDQPRLVGEDLDYPCPPPEKPTVDRDLAHAPFTRHLVSKPGVFLLTYTNIER